MHISLSLTTKIYFVRIFFLLNFIYTHPKKPNFSTQKKKTIKKNQLIIPNIMQKEEQPTKQIQNYICG